MMRIFYIDWQQHWECERTMNIGANAHGERTLSTKQPQRFGMSWQRYWWVDFPDIRQDNFISTSAALDTIAPVPL